MNKKKEGASAKKVQVVIFKKCEDSFTVLLLQTNEMRGGFWQNVTGSIENVDKDIIDGAFREVLEETSINKTQIIKTFKLPLTYKFIDRWKRNVEEFVFCFLVDENVNIVIDQNEHQDFKWVDSEIVTSEYYKYPSNYEVFKMGLQYVDPHN